ncbi:MAG TPA: mercuric reductase [Bryobacteraceae bacterium]|jgi:pyruvate/2-oxoglutarate dehydrogenase complex dihydrolipoamide dehydrogenase (E3) component|nr:mercuric reductase [Bryobacteraceae bacterium]
MTRHYDAIVIGSGQGGTPLARAFAAAKKNTALIERDQVGGTCINYGCTPTKAMVASAEAAYQARRADVYGVHAGEVSVDMMKVRERKRNVVASFRSGSERRVEHVEHLDLLRGDARFTGNKSLAIALHDGATINATADVVFIDTGTRSAIPHIDGLSDVPHLDSTSIMELDAVPERLIVLGGGYVGLEFGQMFRRFGSHVTIANRGPQLLPREDPDIAEQILGILREDGIEVHNRTVATQIRKRGDAIEVDAGLDEPIRGTHLLVATGRVPNTEKLGLEQAGVKTDSHGFIPVNGNLETNVPGIYALGDVNGGPMFTHISYDDFRIVKSNLLEGKSATTEGRMVPYTVFIDPQLGRIGQTETELRRNGRPVQVATMPMSYVARALETDQTRGSMKAVVDPDTKQILGFAALGMQGGEIAAMVQIAMMGRLPYTALRDGIFSHPTLSEALNNLFAQLG